MEPAMGDDPITSFRGMLDSVKLPPNDRWLLDVCIGRSLVPTETATHVLDRISRASNAKESLENALLSIKHDLILLGTKGRRTDYIIYNVMLTLTIILQTQRIARMPFLQSWTMLFASVRITAAASLVRRRISNQPTSSRRLCWKMKMFDQEYVIPLSLIHI